MLPATQRVGRVEIGADGARRLGPATLRLHAGFHVLGVEGGPYDVGLQHGLLVGPGVASGPVPLLARQVQASSGAAAGLFTRSRFGRLVDAMLPTARAALAGLADGTAFPEETLLRAHLWPELASAPAPGIGIAPGAGMGVSLAVPAGRTVRGQALVGRTLDHPAVGRWSSAAAVVFELPEVGYRWVALSAAGLLGAPLGAMNERGVCCLAHPFAPARRGVGGTPIAGVVERLMAEAGTVDEALASLDGFDPAWGWVFLLADGERAARYEVAPGVRRVERDAHWCAGRPRHPDLAAAPLPSAAARAALARQRRLTAAEVAEGWTEEGLVGLLTDHVDPNRGAAVDFGDTVVGLTTVGAVVFRPADRRLWVSSAGGPFVGYDLKQGGPSGKPKRLNPPERPEPARVEALRAGREAVERAVDHGDWTGAFEAARRAADARPEATVWSHLAGLLALRAGEPAEAERLLRVARRGEPLPCRGGRILVGLGWALDLQGRRPEAKACYTEALHLAVEPEVRAAARRGLRTGFTRSAARGLDVDLENVSAR
jgi:hypothetical protein